MSNGDAAPRVVAVVPTYNEATTIVTTIHELIAQPSRPDVIIVDDNSPDGTARLVRLTEAYREGRVRVLEGHRKRGIGPAYRHGFTEALALGYEVIVQLDADGSHPCDSIGTLLEALEHADLAIGSRYVAGGSAVGLVGARRTLSVMGNSYARAFLALGVRDLTGGFKAWRWETLEASNPAESTSDGYAFQIEMTVRAVHAGAGIREVPIRFGPRRGGVSKMNWNIALEALTQVPKMARWTNPGGWADDHD